MFLRRVKKSLSFPIFHYLRHIIFFSGQKGTGALFSQKSQEEARYVFLLDRELFIFDLFFPGFNIWAHAVIWTVTTIVQDSSVFDVWLKIPRKSQEWKSQTITGKIKGVHGGAGEGKEENKRGLTFFYFNFT